MEYEFEEWVFKSLDEIQIKSMMDFFLRRESKHNKKILFERAS